MIQSQNAASPDADRVQPGSILNLKTAGALLFVSIAAVVLNGCRVLATGEWRWLFLSWNLFLAWVPLGCAWAVCYWSSRATTWKTPPAGVGWLLFFPNAPYLFTDLVHLGGSGRLFWLDLMLISLFALTALVVGFVSLRLMHELVASRCGWVTGWLFVGGVAGLSAIGVFIGRFLRWNSWDALINPGQVINSLILSDSLPAGRLKFVLLFSAFVFLSYMMLYALTHLRPAPARLPAWRPVHSQGARVS